MTLEFWWFDFEHTWDDDSVYGTFVIPAVGGVMVEDPEDPGQPLRLDGPAEEAAFMQQHGLTERPKVVQHGDFDYFIEQAHKHGTWKVAPLPEAEAQASRAER